MSSGKFGCGTVRVAKATGMDWSGEVSCGKDVQAMVRAERPVGFGWVESGLDWQCMPGPAEVRKGAW